jgi:hypothetical protein
MLVVARSHTYAYSRRCCQYYRQSWKFTAPKLLPSCALFAEAESEPAITDPNPAIKAMNTKQISDRKMKVHTIEEFEMSTSEWRTRWTTREPRKVARGRVDLDTGPTCEDRVPRDLNQGYRRRIL